MMSDLEETILYVLEKNLNSIWDGDVDTYRATTAEDVSFYEWYISPQRIDGLDFHVRELGVHREVVGGKGRVDHEILQPRIQVYGPTAIVTYTLLIRTASYEGVTHQSHNESRVFHNFGTEEEQVWKLVHCHKSPVATADSLTVLRT
jgi:ketosteroid isomerase-like protein